MSNSTKFATISGATATIVETATRNNPKTVMNITDFDYYLHLRFNNRVTCIDFASCSTNHFYEGDYINDPSDPMYKYCTLNIGMRLTTDNA